MRMYYVDFLFIYKLDGSIFYDFGIRPPDEMQRVLQKMVVRLLDAKKLESPYVLTADAAGAGGISECLRVLG